MNRFQRKLKALFIAVIAVKTLPDELPDELRTKLNEVSELMTEHFTFIEEASDEEGGNRKGLYRRINGVINPAGPTLPIWHRMRQAITGEVVPFNTIDHNAAFGEFVVSTRRTNDDRWQLIESLCKTMLEKRWFPDWSESFEQGLSALGYLFVGTAKTSTYRKITQKEVATDDTPVDTTEEQVVGEEE